MSEIERAAAPTPGPRWRWAPYEALEVDELYAALRMRQEVFVVEQRCPYLDADGRDAQAWHLFGWETTQPERRLVAYARGFRPGVRYAEASIGRIVTDAAVRRLGYGRLLVAEAIAQVERLDAGAPIRIGAQRYLERFYAGFGFVSASDPYDEDGIPHIEMLRPGG